MWLHSLLLLGAFVMSPSIVQASEPVRSDVAIELRSSALIDHPRIVLADVAVIHGHAALQTIALGQAPRVGYVERLTRTQIEQAIRRHAGSEVGAFNWSGASSVAVKIQSQAVTGSDVSAAAMQALRSQFDTSHRAIALSLASPVADVELPAGPVELRARPLQASVLPARVPMWVDLLVNGTVYRSVVVQLSVSSRQPAYRALRDLAQGAWASQEDFAVADADVAGIEAVTVGSQLPAFRLRQNIKAGQLLSTAAQTSSGKVLRGDQVRLFIKSGQIGIETAAVAMAEAMPGQLLAVRPAGGTEIVTGRVSHAGTVTIE